MYPRLNLRPAIKDSELATYSLAFSPDSQVIAAGQGDGSLNLYNTASGRRLFRLLSNAQRPTPVTACAFKQKVNANEPQIVLAAESSGLITYFNAYRGQSVSQLQVMTEPDFKEEKPENCEIYTLKLNNDGTNFACAGKDTKIRIYDTQMAKQLAILKEGDGRSTAGHSNRVFSVAFHDKNQNILYSGGWDQTIQCWDMRVGHSVFSMHSAQIYGDSLDVRDETLLVGRYHIHDQIQLYDLRNPVQPVLDTTINWTTKLNKNHQVDDFDQTYLEKISQINQQQIDNVKFPDDDNIVEEKVPAQAALAEAVAVTTAETPETGEPTLLYDAKFGRTKDTFFAGGSGGREVRLYVNQKCSGLWRAPAAVYCAAASADGRFGVVGGNAFGLQVFGLDPVVE